MILLFNIRCLYLKPVQVELPRANMVIDPRVNRPRLMKPFRIDYHDNGTTVTITRMDEIGWSEVFSFRAYDPNTETVPSFDTTIYTYMGLDDETAPFGTTVVTIHPSVTVIKKEAFSECKRIRKCFLHDDVHTIEQYAFYSCTDMTMIRLSQTLTNIERCAFYRCAALDAIFLPSSVNNIADWAFFYCDNLRMLPLPLHHMDMDMSRMGKKMLEACPIFFQTTQIDKYDYDHVGRDREEEETNRVHRAILDFYRDRVPPLHKACLDTHVTCQTIQQCVHTHGKAIASMTDHDGMTPLHILTMNPHADISTLLACLHLDMSCVFVEDSRGNTPLDYWRVHHDDDSIEDHTLLISSLCIHRDAAAASY